MTTVIAQQTMVTPKQGDFILFWGYGSPRAVRHGDEQFLVTATRLGSLGSGRFYEIQDERGNKSRWHPAHRFEVVS